ncbi:MAG: hypothetical protein K6F33_14575 [Bacteroidales bacterium]|nr:hypothetical protein [Bacteroidales bacterium]
MKRKNFLALMCSMLVMLGACFVACGDDDEEEDEKEQVVSGNAALYGTWKTVSSEFIGSESGKIVSVEYDDSAYILYTFTATELIIETYQYGQLTEKSTNPIIYAGQSVHIQDGDTMLYYVQGNTLTIRGAYTENGEGVVCKVVFKKVSSK